jgi:hypothetical protein
VVFLSVLNFYIKIFIKLYVIVPDFSKEAAYFFSFYALKIGLYAVAYCEGITQTYSHNTNYEYYVCMRAPATLNCDSC